MAAPEPDPTASLHKLATDLFEATMASLRFQMRHGPERDALQQRMPAHLLKIREANRRAQSAESSARYELNSAREEDRWYGEWGQRFAHTRDRAPDDLPALRKVLIEEMEERHARLCAEAEVANKAEQDIQDEWRDAEDKLVKEWCEEHIPHQQTLIAAFKSEIEPHRHRIAGLVDLEKIELGNLANGASTASQVLLKFADRVLHFRVQSCDGLDPDQLRVAVEKEVGWLARTDRADNHPPRKHPKRSTPASLTNFQVVVLRALPSSKQKALATLDMVARAADQTPAPSVSGVSRAIKVLRTAAPPLVDEISYKRTPAGDRVAEQ